ncbi:dipeptidase [Thalassobacillus hwangdonensis]|uniref:Dipeptidase n=1 Tax=Thalassobacillus hwangdonensis TaxID=546108 RepID=A0ABW3KX86_9BACI
MIIDAHCDVLWKLWENDYDFHDSDLLRLNYKKWKKSDVKVQCFAIFVPDDVKEAAQYDVALEMVHIFFDRIIAPYDDVKFITSKEELISLAPHAKGAMLTLEGCHAIGHDLNKLKTLINMGVRAVGLTWNQANATCDGIEEKRGAGLSSFGEEVVDYLNEERIWTDVSHLSYQGFWDVMNRSQYPMASHSNVLELAGHPRNLDKDQLTALIKRKAWIGITFVPEFINGQTEAEWIEVLPHIDYILRMGGEDCLGFGSDFEGIDDIVKGLYDVNDFTAFVQQLIPRYGQRLVEKMSYVNFIDKFPRLR